MKILSVVNFLYSRLKKKKNIEWTKSEKKSFCIDFSNALKCGFRPASVRNSLIKFTSEHLKRL